MNISEDAWSLYIPYIVDNGGAKWLFVVFRGRKLEHEYLIHEWSDHRTTLPASASSNHKKIISMNWQNIAQPCMHECFDPWKIPAIYGIHKENWAFQARRSSVWSWGVVLHNTYILVTAYTQEECKYQQKLESNRCLFRSRNFISCCKNARFLGTC